MKYQLLWVSHACSGFMGEGQYSTQNPQRQGAGFTIGIYTEVSESRSRHRCALQRRIIFCFSFIDFFY